jgi:hypothetical protein
MSLSPEYRCLQAALSAMTKDPDDAGALASFAAACYEIGLSEWHRLAVVYAEAGEARRRSLTGRSRRWKGRFARC